MSTQARAIVLMIGAIFCFSLMDVAAKALGQRVDMIQTLWARYTGQAVLVLLIVAPRLRSVARTRHPKLQLLRSVCLLGATAFFFYSFNFIGLAEATAVMDLNPVLITLGAALFLGERIGPRRMAGILVALVGALLIIRPGTSVFSPPALLPLGAALCYSAYALATRFVGRSEDIWTSLVYTALFGALVLSAIVPWFWQPVDATSAAIMVGIGSVGTLGQLLLISALRQGEAGMLAPYAYTGLVFATVWGILFFGELPDVWTVAGALVIVGAGLYVWHRETFGRRS